MRAVLPLLLAGLASACGVASADEPPAEPEPVSLYTLEVESLEGEPVALADYRGKVTLVVNVASRCGYTPQYAGLQALHAEYAERGFAVLGFPCNDFGRQEPGTAEEIREFCTLQYGVGFPMFAKVQSRAGEGQSPVYGVLAELTGELPTWNFGKYLVTKDGRAARYFPSDVAPEDDVLREAIEAALAPE